jgi:hypothetical protein
MNQVMQDLARFSVECSKDNESKLLSIMKSAKKEKKLTKEHISNIIYVVTNEMDSLISIIDTGKDSDSAVKSFYLESLKVRVAYLEILIQDLKELKL